MTTEVHPARARSFAVSEFDASRVPEAAELLADRLERVKAAFPYLPLGGFDAEHLRGALTWASGVAAVRDGRLVGYILGIGITGTRGAGKAAFVPEWGWAVDPSADPETFTEMYRLVSATWARRGWSRHLIAALNVDSAFEPELAWLGFAPCVVDAVRDLSVDLPASPQPARITFAPANSADVDELAELDRLLDDHLTAAPTFLYRDPADDAADWAASILAGTGNSVWVAREDGRPISFICLSREAEGVADVVGDPGVIHVVAAFTQPEYRSRGIAEALLAMALQKAREAGHLAAAVDFETANPLARRFWSRLFAPICVSYERHVDPRMVASEASR